MRKQQNPYVVVDDKQIARVREALEDVVGLIYSLQLGCEIAYQREPTQAEGDAHELRPDQSMGPSYGIDECHVPMGDHHGHRCKCGSWVWDGPAMCQRCVDADAVKIAIDRADAAERIVETAQRTLACVAESMTKRAYQEMVSALEAPPRTADRTAATKDFDPPGSEYTAGDSLGLRRER